MPVVAALDIGGTKTAAALVTSEGEIRSRALAPTPGREGPDAILATAARVVADLSADEGVDRPAALGVGSAGVIDSVEGVVLGATDTLAGWAGTRLADRLSAATGLPCDVINDVHAHALGEAAFGAAIGCRTVLFVGVGTGVGGAFVVNGAVLPGAHSAAGHVGHQPSPYAGQLTCACGGTGHLEALASGPGLHAEFRRRGGQGADDLRGVAALADAGDEIAESVIQLGGTAVGSAVGGLINVFDPHIVVVGGGVSGLGDRWWKALRHSVDREVLPSLRGVPVVPSTLGGDAALLGAAALAWSALERREAS